MRGTKAHIGWSMTTFSLGISACFGFIGRVLPSLATSQTMTFFTPLLCGSMTRSSLSSAPLARQCGSFEASIFGASGILSSAQTTLPLMLPHCWANAGTEASRKATNANAAERIRISVVSVLQLFRLQFYFTQVERAGLGNSNRLPIPAADLFLLVALVRL